MKKFSAKNRSARYLVSLALAVSALSATPAQAAVVTFACPSGGGSYLVNNGVLTGTSGECGGDLVLDSSVTTINYVSLSDTSITSLTIPASVQTITNPFYYTSNLVSINVDSASTTFKSVDGVLFNYSGTFLIAYPASKSGSTYTIPSSVTHIGIYAFGSNKYLTSMSIPNGVTHIEGGIFIGSQVLSTVNIGTGLTTLGSQAFAWIETMTAINVDAGNASFASIDGVLYNKNISKLWAYPAAKAGTSYTSPSTVTATDFTVFGAASNLLTVDLSSVTTLMGQEFMDSTSIREVTLGNSLTRIRAQLFQSASGLKKIYLGTGLTTIDDYVFSSNNRLYCIIYSGSNSTIQNFAYPNGVVPVASSSECLANPAITLTNSMISGTVGTEINSYTLSSSGGAVASYSISPDISYIPGLSFSTTTGIISGTPLYSSASRTFTVTATNAADIATQTFTIVIRPIPVPFLNTLSAPKLQVQDGKLLCSAGSYEFGYTLDGEIDSSTSGVAAPSSFTYALLVNGQSQTTSVVKSASSTNSWSIAQAASGSVVSCSVTATVNSLSIGNTSSENTDGYAAAQKALKLSKASATEQYKLALKAHNATFMSTFHKNRALWQKKIDATRANYYTILERLKASPGSGKMIADAATALQVMNAAKAAAQAEYATSRPLANEARDASNAAALSTRDAAIAKANAIYGTFIESIGYGVLIP